MKEFIQSCIMHKTLGSWILLIFSIAILTAGFILPPIGIIDNSVLLGVGMLNTFGVLYFKLDDLIASIKDGKSLTIRHGDSEIRINDEDGEN